MTIEELLDRFGVQNTYNIVRSLRILELKHDMSMEGISRALDERAVKPEEFFEALNKIPWHRDVTYGDVIKKLPELHEWFCCLVAGLKLEYMRTVPSGSLDRTIYFRETSTCLHLLLPPPFTMEGLGHNPSVKPTEQPTEQPTVKPKETIMTTSIVATNKAAAVTAAKLKAGSVLNATAIAALKKSGAVPMMARGYLDHPLAAVLIANLAGYAAAYTGNQKAKQASELMLQAAMLSVMNTVDIEGFVSSIIENPKVIKALEGISASESE